MVLAEPIAVALQVANVLQQLDLLYLRHWATQLGVDDLLARALAEGNDGT